MPVRPAIGAPLTVLAIACLGGCDSPAPPLAPTSTSPPTVVRPSAPMAAGLWTTNRTVTAVTDLRPTPDWAPAEAAGDVRPDVTWRITLRGNDIIELDEDLSLAPMDHNAWSGTLRGVQFEASISTGDDYLRWPSAYRGGTLRGTFSDDFSTFEAESRLSWGPPGADLTVTYRWKGAR